MLPGGCSTKGALSMSLWKLAELTVVSVRDSFAKRVDFQHTHIIFRLPYWKATALPNSAASTGTAADWRPLPEQSKQWFDCAVRTFSNVPRGDGVTSETCIVKNVDSQVLTTFIQTVFFQFVKNIFFFYSHMVRKRLVRDLGLLNLLPGIRTGGLTKTSPRTASNVQ